MSEVLRVLIVDDQAIILEAVRSMLVDAPELELHLLADSSVAIETALRVKPHVILLDFNMEPLDGLAVLSLIRSNPELTDVSVVMLSAAEEPETKVEAFRRGANDYVVKLPSALELIARVRYHARACAAAEAREVGFRALLESRAALELRNQVIEKQKVQLESMNRELTEASLTDALTGLRNRRYLKFFLDQPEPNAPLASERRQQERGRFTICLFDLDHFKQVNDRYGHEVGDNVLVEVARRLRASMRESDGLLRWGGEEFLVVGRGFDPDGAQQFAQRVLNCISGSDMHLTGGLRLRVTCSMGFAPLPWGDQPGAGLTREQVLNLADFALYLSKLEGRNRACGVAPGPDLSLPQRMSELSLDAHALRHEDGRGVHLHRLLGPTASG
ncbi:MAG: diguanylate cyclase [Pseudomarimonas sp.]